MSSHAPSDYVCPFCDIVAGRFENTVTNEQDVVLRTSAATAFVASHQWPNNAGHVLVIPNDHHENLYALPASLAEPIHETVRRVALALKVAFECPGVSTRQHNEPAGGQDVWHYHVHVFPRYHGDGLYGADRQAIGDAGRAAQAEALRAALRKVE